MSNLLQEIQAQIAGAKHITPAIEQRSSAFHRAFLRGLFDADGSVHIAAASSTKAELYAGTLGLSLSDDSFGASVGVLVDIDKTRAFIGEGAANQGAFHEVCNMVGLWKLPVIVVVQDNEWGVSTAKSESTAVECAPQRYFGVWKMNR